MKRILATICLSTLPLSSFATPVNVNEYVAVSAFLGPRISDDLKDSATGETAKISNEMAGALALSWYYSRNKEGELLFSSSKLNVSLPERDISTDMYVSYLHFGGRVLFTNETAFSTSLGLGVGATFFSPDDSQYDNEIALSGNITGGVRYELNEQLALRGDLRVYGTLLNSSSTMLCGDGECLINLSGEVYVQTEIMAGVEFKF